MSTIPPELERLSKCVDALDELRRLFYSMVDDGERERAWRYLADRFGEFEGATMPAWENLQYADIEAEVTA